jgi:hypothetical protein
MNAIACVLIDPNASYVAVACAQPFLPDKAPADDRIQKGEANHSGSTKAGQMSAVTQTKSRYFLRPAMGK